MRRILPAAAAVVVRSCKSMKNAKINGPIYAKYREQISAGHGPFSLYVLRPVAVPLENAETCQRRPITGRMREYIKVT